MYHDNHIISLCLECNHTSPIFKAQRLQASAMLMAMAQQTLPAYYAMPAAVAAAYCGVVSATVVGCQLKSAVPTRTDQNQIEE